MRIEKYLNTTKEEVENKSFNIWIGISLGNKYFTKEHIQAYIVWALEHTKEKVLVVVADALHATNLEVLDRRTSKAALRKALQIGDIKFDEVKEIISKLTHEQRTRINVVRWKDIVDTEEYKNNIAIILDAYKNNFAFRQEIQGITKLGRKDRSDRLEKLSEAELDRLCDYVLNEIPHFVNGVQGYGDNIVYTLIPYPGLSKLDELFVGLQNKKLFPEVAERLNITNKIAILEAYVE